MRGFFEFTCLLMILLIATLAVLAAIVAGHEFVTVRGKIAGIEQLREDSQRVRGTEAAGVLQLVAQANGEIAFYKALNVHPLLGWTIPDDWADVRLIRIRMLRDVEPDAKPIGSQIRTGEPARNFGYTPNATESERFIRSLEKGAQP